MSEQIFNTRIVHKHDTETNWNKAVNFIPKQGELIVYDVDDTYSYVRTKIGDGVKTVTELPFIVKQSDWEQNDETALDFVKNRTHYAEWQEGVIFDNVTLTYDEVETTWYYEGEGALPVLAAGKEYKININGQQYTSILQVIYEEEGLPTYGLGNLGAFDASYEDSGESFIVLFLDYDPGDGSNQIGLAAFDLEGTFGNSLVITIEGKNSNNIKKLDEIYMPDSYTEVKSGISELFDEVSSNDSEITSLWSNVNQSVKYYSQSLTDAQKAQARTNIGAASLSDIPEIPEFTQVQADLSETDETSAAYVNGKIQSRHMPNGMPYPPSADGSYGGTILSLQIDSMEEVTNFPPYNYKAILTDFDLSPIKEVIKNEKVTIGSYINGIETIWAFGWYLNDEIIAKADNSKGSVCLIELGNELHIYSNIVLSAIYFSRTYTIIGMYLDASLLPPCAVVRSDLEDLASESYVDTSIANLVNSAPETLDTLGELATAMQENQGVVNALNQAIANKADNTTVENLQTIVDGKAENSALNDHTSNTTIHITAVERTTWNAKMDADAELITTADIDAICGSVTPIAEVLF